MREDMAKNDSLVHQDLRERWCVHSVCPNNVKVVKVYWYCGNARKGEPLIRWFACKAAKAHNHHTFSFQDGLKPKLISNGKQIIELDLGLSLNLSNQLVHVYLLWPRKIVHCMPKFVEYSPLAVSSKRLRPHCHRWGGRRIEAPKEQCTRVCCRIPTHQLFNGFAKLLQLYQYFSARDSTRVFEHI
jgi:hypothetical protein